VVHDAASAHCHVVSLLCDAIPVVHDAASAHCHVVSLLCDAIPVGNDAASMQCHVVMLLCIAVHRGSVLEALGQIAMQAVTNMLHAACVILVSLKTTARRHQQSPRHCVMLCTCSHSA
jgi:hypothetical protein